MLTTADGRAELKKYVQGTKPSVIGINQAGCTANVLLITDTHIYCANAGDARTVACVQGKSLDLSKDHKPTLPAER